MNQMSLHRQIKQRRQAAEMSAFVKKAITSPVAYWSSLFISGNDTASNPIEGYKGLEKVGTDK